MPVTPEHIRSAAAAIGGLIRHTPVIDLGGEEFGIDGSLALKLEQLQHSGTFKGRGAAHFLATQPIGAAGVVAASGGNHGVAVAWAAQRAGFTANIFVPTISAPAKVARLRTYGAIVHQVGDVYGESLDASRAFQSESGATSIHAYDDPVVMAGAGTCGLEFDEQAPGLDTIFIACGGGGLAGGVASWFGTRAQIVVCETEGTAAYAKAREAGRPVDVDVSGLAADALGATRIGNTPWEALSAVDAASVLVTDEELAAAQDRLWEQFRIVVEPSAATPLAALLSGRWPVPTGGRVGLILCGANTAIT